MSDNIINHEKDVDQTTTPGEETKTVVDQVDSDETTMDSDEATNEINYKEELESKKSKAQHDRQGYEKRKGPQETHTVADKETLQQLIRNEMDTLSNQVTRQNALMVAKSLSKSNDEVDLTMWHYENSVKKTGDITEDMSNAHFLANKKRYTQDLSEARRSATAADNRSKGVGAGSKKSYEVKPTLTPEEKKLAIRMKISEEELIKAKMTQ